jgi:hypothetical protein
MIFQEKDPFACLAVPDAVCVGLIPPPFCHFAVEEPFEQIWAPFKVTTIPVRVTVKRIRHVSIWNDGSKHTRIELHTYGKGLSTLTTPPPRPTWRTLGTTL